MKISKKIDQCLLVCLNSFLLLFFSVFSAFASWQSTLENKFDIVETFDELQDWKPLKVGGISIQSYPDIFPKKIDGSPSIWQYYYLDGDAKNIQEPWIKDHGPDNVWRNSGKSMVIDYGLGNPTEILGPNRLGFKIGSTPSDGYPSEVFIFYMIKVPKGFFKTTSGSFDYHRFLKTLDVSAGFKTVREWGTDEQRSWLYANCVSPYPKGQVISEYGMNAQVWNFQSFSGIEGIKPTVLYTQQTGEEAAFCHYNDSTVYQLPDAEIGVPVLNERWFGIEYRIKMSNPHGTATGQLEAWVYDEKGTVLGHQIVIDMINFKDGKTSFNHSWNKFVWGGNRFDGLYCPNGISGCDFGTLEHYYIDDIIVDNGRIGPEYFPLTGSPIIININAK